MTTLDQVVVGWYVVARRLAVHLSKLELFSFIAVRRCSVTQLTFASF